MDRWRGQVWGFGVLAALLALGGCSKILENDFPSPDSSKIVAYYPIDDVVIGRGYAGAIPGTHVLVNAPRSNLSKPVPTQVASDGSFEFRIIARAGDVLEFTTTNADSTLRSESVFLEIPIPVEVKPHGCCMPEGTCMPRDQLVIPNVVCDENAQINSCQLDSDCAFFENQTIPIRVETFEVTRPNEMGMISVSGQIIPKGFIRLENRGLAGFDMGESRGRLEQIADPQGRFKFELPARGDDELVMQLRDLRGHSSAQGARVVPDAEPLGVDLVSVIPWEPLSEGQRGRVALVVSPYGIDGFGLCPNDSTIEPITCVGGGINHAHLFIDAVSIGDAEKATIDPAPTQGPPAQILGAEPDLRSGPRDVVLVIDMSDAVPGKEAEGIPRRLVEAANFAHNISGRDRVGLVTFGAQTKEEVSFGVQDGKAAVISRLEALENETPQGPSELFDAVSIAVEMIRTAPALQTESRSGHIIVIALGPPQEGEEDAKRRASEITDDIKLSGPPTVINIIGVDLPKVGAVTRGLVNLAGFSSIERSTGAQLVGGVFNIDDVFQLGQELVELRARLFGGFILLFDMTIPADAKKRDCIGLSLSLTLEGINGQLTFSDDYLGPLTVTNSPGAASICRPAP